MSDLKIPEVILRERRKKNLTQEELAAQLGVSSQAISNWERGGYPDITLLPRIANFFGITVDELIGNDEVNRTEDINNFNERFWSMGSSKEALAERLALAKEYYAKYPGDYGIMHDLGYAIVKNKPTLAENAPLLKEIHEKIMAGCTYEQYRRDSIHYMCYVCTDEELEERIGNSELDWSEAVAIGELREERFLLHERYAEYYRERNANDLLIFMQYLGRNNMNYYGSAENDYVFAEPERTAAWEKHKLRLIEAFAEDGEVPDAWCGCYAEFTLKAAGALIGCGRIDEGFEMLEKAFPRYERWLKIPAGALMDAGCADVFGGAKITKWSDTNSTDIHFADGKEVWTPYLWLFWQLKNDIEIAMRTWKWFDGVREDARYAAFYEKAKALAQTE